MTTPVRVLIVEDSEPDARLLMRELRKADFEPSYMRVETPEAMRTALKQDNWDLIIADYTMPHFSGPDALRLLQESGREIPLILVSGTVPEDVAIRMMQMGAQDFIPKNDLARLGVAVARELRASHIQQERRRAEEALRAEESHRLEFYRRTIQAATDGKLIICDHEDIVSLAGPAIASWELRTPDQLESIRNDVEKLAAEQGLDPSRMNKFMVCVGEASTNTLKHAGGGRVSLHRLDEALICVVEDRGPGIEAMSIPDVALVRGFSTAGTLGMGYKMMIQFADRVYLATGPQGTIAAIEMLLQEPKPEEETNLMSAIWKKAEPTE